MTCPKCGGDLKPKAIQDQNYLLCDDCPNFIAIQQPSLEEVYTQREQLRVAMGRVWS